MFRAFRSRADGTPAPALIVVLLLFSAPSKKMLYATPYIVHADFVLLKPPLTILFGF